MFIDLNNLSLSHCVPNILKLTAFSFRAFEKKKKKKRYKYVFVLIVQNYMQ